LVVLKKDLYLYQQNETTMRTTTTITKEVKNIKSVNLKNDGRSRIDVFVDNKKVSNNARKEAIIALEGNDVKTTTSVKTYDLDWNLLNEDIKVEQSEYMNLVRQAIKGYINR